MRLAALEEVSAGAEPGVALHEIVLDQAVAEALKVEALDIGRPSSISG